MKTLKNILRRWVLTPEEQTLLAASDASLLRALLNDHEYRLLQAARAAAHYQPEPEITEEDARAWEEALRTPVGLKVDTAMINWLQTEAQRAIAAQSSEVLASAKYALGLRAGWEMAKSLPRLAAAQSSKPEDSAPTAAPGLDRHLP